MAIVRQFMVVLLVIGWGGPLAWGDEPSVNVGGIGAGIGKFRDQTWGLVNATVHNPTDQQRDMLVIVATDQKPNVQVARPVWMPALSTRRLWVPLRAGSAEKAADRSLAANAMLLDAAATERAAARERLLLLREISPISTGMIIGTDHEAPVDAAIAAQVAQGASGGISSIRAAAAPAVALGYQGLDNLLLATDLAVLDSSQMSALRAWLVAGGRLWIMLDATPTEQVGALLGAAWNVQVVDRVELCDFRVTGSDEPLHVTVEQPIEMVRVLAPGPGVSVVHRVEGWPASFTLPVGQGAVLVTTLGPQAWVDAKKRATPPLETLAGMYLGRQRQVPRQVAWSNFLSQRIGYEVIDKGLVGGVLMSFCVLLLIAGFVLHRQGRLERIGWIAAGLGVVTALVVVGLGALHRGQTPRTVVSGALLEAAPGQRVVTMRGSVEAYLPGGGSEDTFASTTGGDAWPSVVDNAGNTVRMVWTDVNAWHWQNLSLPRGLPTSATFTTTRQLSQPVQGTLTFDEQGCVGTVVLADGTPLVDAVLAGPMGRLAPRWPSAGVFTATSADSLASDQYIVAAVAASDEQLRHQAVYRDLFAAQGFQGVYRPSQPTMLGWTDLSSGIGVSQTESRGVSRASSNGSTDQGTRVDESLAIVPLNIRRPPAGTTVHIPVALMAFEVAKGGAVPQRSAGGGAANLRRVVSRLSTVYEAKSGQWLEVTNTGVMEVVFMPPGALLPLRPTRATFELEIRAPGRTVTLSALQGDTAKPLGTLQSPGASRSFTIDFDPRAAALMQPGEGIHVLIEVGESEQESLWQIRSTALDLTGVIEPEN